MTTSKVTAHSNPTQGVHLRLRYWRRVRRLTLGLLCVWAGLSVLGPWYARELNAWSFFGFPLGFWLNAQGAILVFLALVVIYAVVMDRWDAALRDADASSAGAKHG